MFDADVDSLLDISISDSFINDDADGGFRYIVDNTGFAMVDFVGHAVGMCEDLMFLCNHLSIERV